MVSAWETSRYPADFHPTNRFLGALIRRFFLRGSDCGSTFRVSGYLRLFSVCFLKTMVRDRGILDTVDFSGSVPAASAKRRALNRFRPFSETTNVTPIPRFGITRQTTQSSRRGTLSARWTVKLASRQGPSGISINIPPWLISVTRPQRFFPCQKISAVIENL